MEDIEFIVFASNLKIDQTGEYFIRNMFIAKKSSFMYDWIVDGHSHFIAHFVQDSSL
jgi:hypothetical protein